MVVSSSVISIYDTDDTYVGSINASNSKHCNRALLCFSASKCSIYSYNLQLYFRTILNTPFFLLPSLSYKYVFRWLIGTIS